MAAAAYVFIAVSVMNVTFLPGFQKEALKRDLNRKQGTSEISQATTARWIIQSKLTCSHICRGMQECVFIFIVALKYICLIYGLYVFWVALISGNLMDFYSTVWTNKSKSPEILNWQRMHMCRELPSCPFYGCQNDLYCIIYIFFAFLVLDAGLETSLRN